MRMMSGRTLLLHRVDRESHRWIHRLRRVMGERSHDIVSSYFFSRVTITNRALARGREGAGAHVHILAASWRLNDGLMYKSTTNRRSQN